MKKLFFFSASSNTLAFCEESHPRMWQKMSFHFTVMDLSSALCGISCVEQQPRNLEFLNEILNWYVHKISLIQSDTVPQISCPTWFYSSALTAALIAGAKVWLSVYFLWCFINILREFIKNIHMCTRKQKWAEKVLVFKSQKSVTNVRIDPVLSLLHDGTKQTESKVKITSTVS